jgi:hypothetical protein
MVRGGRAEAPVPRSDVRFRLDQKTDNSKVAMPSRVMQWSPLPEEKQKNQLAHLHAKRVSLHKNNNNNNNKGRYLPAVLRLYISVALQQKTGNFKASIGSRAMQWGPLTEEKAKNEIAQKEFRFIKTIIIIIIRGGNYVLVFASISALHCSKRRQTSRWPSRAERCSGVR